MREDFTEEDCNRYRQNLQQIRRIYDIQYHRLLAEGYLEGRKGEEYDEESKGVTSQNIHIAHHITPAR